MAIIRWIGINQKDMTTITTQIEFIDETGEYDCFDAELTGNPIIQDDTYSDEYGVVAGPVYFVLDGEPTWRRKDYTELQNVQIADYIAANQKAIEELFFNEY